jgi:hypothetical protein
MKNKYLIISSVIIVLLVARLIVTQVDKYAAEKKWYIENLSYDFKSVIDTIVVHNKEKGKGYFICHPTSGAFNRFVEDSLKQHLVQYKWLRVFPITKKGKIARYTKDIFKYEEGDSVYVNSSKDIFLVTRNRKIISDEKISNIIFEQLL